MRSAFTPTGRLKGCFVYMILCVVDGQLRAKIGYSSDPLKRFRALVTGCPVVPEELSVLEVAGPVIAKKVEEEMHAALKQWNVHHEWFGIPEAEKAAFATRLREVLTRNSDSSRSLRWVRYSVAKILASLHQRQMAGRRRFCEADLSFRDAVERGLKLV